MKIGIEINHVIRDINSQIIKYYAKDIDKNFDEKNVDKTSLNLIDKVGFKNKKAKENFLYVDYPYEIFGCANTTHRHTSSMLNKWMEEMDNNGFNGSNVSLFSLKENALTIQSSYYFLSKIGCRVRNVFFPKDGKEMWNKCDIIITTNEYIVNNKPEDKKVILIKTNDNSHLMSKCDFVYSDFYQLLNDKTLFKVLSKEHKKKETLLGKIKNKIKKIIG